MTPTGELRRSLLGVTVETTKACPVGTIWVADGAQVVAVVRTDGTVAVSRDAGFTRDQTLGPGHLPDRLRAYPFPAAGCELTAV